MKKLYFIIPIIAVIGFYLAYVLPFGLNQSKVEKEFNVIKTQIDNFNKEIAKTNTIEIFNQKIDAIVSIKSTFANFKITYNDLESTRNSLRNSVWKKQSVFSSDVDNIDSLFQKINQSMPVYLSKIIESNSNNIATSSSDLKNIKSIKDNLEDFKSNLIVLTKKLELFNNSFSNPALKISEIDLEKIYANNSKIISNIASIESSQKDNLIANIKQSNSVKDINNQIKDFNSFLGIVKNSLRTISEIGASTTALKKADDKLENDIKQINGITNLLKSTLVAQGKSNDLLKSALKTMDAANNRLNKMEKFASSDAILKVYSSWSEAESDVKKSKNPLYYSGSSSTHKIIWNNLNAKAKGNIDKILVDVTKHKNFIYSEYSKAKREESTYAGNATRTAKRGWNRLKKAANQALNQAKTSRIGRELSLSTKMLVLGTKAFYDLQDPNTDLMTWGMSYENDVNSLMQESDEIMQMDGPSLTGKNTFIESYTNKAYEKSFK